MIAQQIINECNTQKFNSRQTMSETSSKILKIIRDQINKEIEIERNFYQKQIKGLILVMQQVEGGAFVSRKYVVEKLNMILDGGIGFHALIEEKLNE